MKTTLFVVVFHEFKPPNEGRHPVVDQEQLWIFSLFL